jgi:hypothetical protein
LLDTPIPDRDVIGLAGGTVAGGACALRGVEDYISDTYEKAEPDKKTAVGFVMTIYRRRLASSFAALRSTLSDRLDKLTRSASADDQSNESDEDISQDETADEVMGADEALAYEREALKVEEREEILKLLRGIAKLGTDTKALRLLDKLKDAFQAGYDSALVFTQYTDTMDFLRDFLAERLNMPIGCFSAVAVKPATRRVPGSAAPRSRSSGCCAPGPSVCWCAPMPPPRGSICKAAACWRTTTCRGIR